MVNILLGVSGSVATIKAGQVVSQLQEKIPDCQVEIVATQHSLHFLNTIKDLPEVKIHRDSDEWSSWQGRGDPVVHIELRKWADLMVIAPLSANTLAKISNGICDNLLTCVARAWDFKNTDKKVFFAPAMNTCMWEHPITGDQIEKLKTWGFVEIPPISKTLMCKDTGMGAMAEPHTIAQTIVSHLDLCNSRK